MQKYFKFHPLRLLSKTCLLFLLFSISVLKAQDQNNINLPILQNNQDVVKLQSGSEFDIAISAKYSPICSKPYIEIGRQSVADCREFSFQRRFLSLYASFILLLNFRF